MLYHYTHYTVGSDSGFTVRGDSYTSGDNGYTVGGNGYIPCNVFTHWKVSKSHSLIDRSAEHDAMTTMDHVINQPHPIRNTQLIIYRYDQSRYLVQHQCDFSVIAQSLQYRNPIPII